MKEAEVLDGSVGLLFTRAEDGREIFAPWSPFRQTGYVVPSLEKGRSIRRSLRGQAVAALLLVVLFVVGRRSIGLPWQGDLLLGLAILLAYAIQVRRLTSGLERVSASIPLAERLNRSALTTKAWKLFTSELVALLGVVLSLWMLRAGFDPWLSGAALVFSGLGAAHQGYRIWLRWRGRRAGPGVQ